MKKILFIISVISTINLAFIDTYCMDLVYNYHQCTKLKMYNSSGNFYPNSSIPGNSLNETILAYLQKMQINQAMNLYRRIYQQSLCNSFTCACIKSMIDKSGIGYDSSFIKSNRALAGTRKMIIDLNNDRVFKKRKLNETTIISYILDRSKLNSSSVAKFCSKYEYSSYLANFYNNFDYCKSSPSQMVNICLICF